MKFCSECGKELQEGAELCSNCGFTINTNQNKIGNANFKRNLQTVAKIFMVLACVRGAFFVGYAVLCAFTIPNALDVWQIFVLLGFDNITEILKLLKINYHFAFMFSAVINAIIFLWMVIMTVYYFKATAKQKHVGIVFMILSLFISPVAGILMLISEYYQKKPNINENDKI